MMLSQDRMEHTPYAYLLLKHDGNQAEQKSAYHDRQVNGLSGMKDVSVTGLISRIMNRYVITADDGTQYELSAIYPWEAVSTDYGSGIFVASLGKRVTASGITDGHTIWKASFAGEVPSADMSKKPESGPAKRSTKARSPSKKC
jgi:hypothetical protein